MGNKLFVGNLSFALDDIGLEEIFKECGTVQSARVIKDRSSGRSKGFGFVEMGNDEEASDAIEKLNGAEREGRSITVAEAKPKPDRG